MAVAVLVACFPRVFCKSEKCFFECPRLTSIECVVVCRQEDSQGIKRRKVVVVLRHMTVSREKSRITCFRTYPFSTFGILVCRQVSSTDDVFQRFVLNLYRSLSEVRPQNGRAFLGLAAVQIRRKLIDLARHYRLENQAYKSSERVSDSELGDAGSVESVAHLTAGPATLQRWTEFHQLVDELPTEEREIMGLLYYQGLSQSEAAEILQVSERTVKRRWREARLKLHQLLGDSLLD